MPSSAPKHPMAVIFDLDGVLVDSESLHVEAWKVLFGRHGLDVTADEFAHGVGMADADWLAWLFRQRSWRESVEPWQEAKREVFQDILARNVRPFPGAVGLVRRLSPEFRLAIASNSWRRNIETVVDALGLGECFGALVGADDVERCKPAPDVYLRAADLLGVLPAACTVIEDSPLGVQAAKAAGMRCIGVTNSLPAEALRGADVILGGLADAEAIVAFARGSG